MDFMITKDEIKPLLQRRDVSARIAFEQGTPSRLEIRKAASAALNAKEEHVLITKILPEVGSPSAKIDLRVYENEKAIKNIEHEFTLVRHGLVEKKGKTSAPAQK